MEVYFVFFLFKTEAIEFIDRVYEMYAVGKVEIYLVQPTDMSQVRERSEEDEGEEGEAEVMGTNASNPLANITPLRDDDIEDEAKAAVHEGVILEHGVDRISENKASDINLGGHNQSNMKWNKKGDPSNPGGNAQQPLASYDVGFYCLQLSLRVP